MFKSWSVQKHEFENFFDFIEIEANIGSDENKKPFQNKLDEFSILKQVPFSYLVPYEEMLYDNQIRFFYLDYNWIKALLDGVMSIGRCAGIDYYNDMTFLDGICQRTVANNINVRRTLQKKTPVFKESEEPTLCTGFLLRSQLVMGWRGLEFKAYGDLKKMNELRIIRLEALSEDVLIGLFEGEICRLDIMQPPESFHFGFTISQKGLEKTLRDTETGKLNNKKVVVAERNDERVIDFAKTAANIKEALQTKEIGSAVFALEMIQNPFKAEIEIVKEDAK